MNSCFILNLCGSCSWTSLAFSWTASSLGNYPVFVETMVILSMWLRIQKGYNEYAKIPNKEDVFSQKYIKGIDHLIWGYALLLYHLFPISFIVDVYCLLPMANWLYEHLGNALWTAQISYIVMNNGSNWSVMDGRVGFRTQFASICYIVLQCLWFLW